MIKNEPATPLPWETDHGASRNAVLHVGAETTEAFEQALWFNKRQDAVYAAHAINAYPLLVETLQEALVAMPGGSWAHITSGPCTCKSCTQKKGRALLIGLGEDPT